MDAVSLSPRAAKLTYEDFLLLPEDGLRHELLDGEHVVTPSPSLRHQEIVGRLYLLIGQHVRARGLGRLFLAPLDVVLSEHDVTEPDLLFVATERLSRLTPANVQGAPSLLIEVLSPTTERRDRTVKRRIYDRFGVEEYWLVDGERREVTVIDFVAQPATERRHRDRFSSRLLPGLEIDLHELFADD
jgi:Uma2 family endonuclease